MQKLRQNEQKKKGVYIHMKKSIFAVLISFCMFTGCLAVSAARGILLQKEFDSCKILWYRSNR